MYKRKPNSKKRSKSRGRAWLRPIETDSFCSYNSVDGYCCTSPRSGGSTVCEKHVGNRATPLEFMRSQQQQQQLGGVDFLTRAAWNMSFASPAAFAPIMQAQIAQQPIGMGTGGSGLWFDDASLQQNSLASMMSVTGGVGLFIPPSSPTPTAPATETEQQKPEVNTPPPSPSPPLIPEVQVPILPIGTPNVLVVMPGGNVVKVPNVEKKTETGALPLVPNVLAVIPGGEVTKVPAITETVPIAIVPGHTGPQIQQQQEQEQAQAEIIQKPLEVIIPQTPTPTPEVQQQAPTPLQEQVPSPEPQIIPVPVPVPEAEEKEKEIPQNPKVQEQEEEKEKEQPQTPPPVQVPTELVPQPEVQQEQEAPPVIAQEQQTPPSPQIVTIPVQQQEQPIVQVQQPPLVQQQPLPVEEVKVPQEAQVPKQTQPAEIAQAQAKPIPSFEELLNARRVPPGNTVPSDADYIKISDIPARNSFDPLMFITNGLMSEDRDYREKSSVIDIAKKIFPEDLGRDVEMQTTLALPPPAEPLTPVKYKAGFHERFFGILNSFTEDEWIKKYEEASDHNIVIPNVKTTIICGLGSSVSYQNPPLSKSEIEASQYYNSWYMMADPRFKGAVFQAASNFNSLEQTNPNQRPGYIRDYFGDRTQGPVTALGGYAATMWRRYAWSNRTSGPQPDDLLNERWSGYPGVLVKPNFEDVYANVLTTIGGWLDLRKATLNMEGEDSIDNGAKRFVRSICRISRGFGATCVTGCDAMLVRRQSDDRVALLRNPNNINQVYVSAVDNSVVHRYLLGGDPERTARFRSAALLAAYMNTLLFAMRSRSSKVVLTMMGGGVFGNSYDMILDAMFKSIRALVRYCIEKKDDYYKTMHVYLVLYDRDEEHESALYYDRVNPELKYVRAEDIVRTFISMFNGKSTNFDWVDFESK